MNAIKSYTEDLFSLAGRIALVTGGASGIGAMMTRTLVSAGARTYISSRNQDALDAMALELQDLPGECIPFSADLSEAAGVRKLAGFLTDEEPELHILVNNSGRTWGAPYEQFPWDAWESVMTLNVTAPFNLTRELTPLLARAGEPGNPARVINLGSVMGTMPHGMPAYSYSASKAALHHVTRYLANELAARHITVNAIAPGVFHSKMTAYFLREEKSAAAVRKAVPLGRLGAEQDIAGLLLCLCGAGGAYISGAVIPLDGGMSVFRTPGLEQGLE